MNQSLVVKTPFLILVLLAFVSIAQAQDRGGGIRLFEWHLPQTLVPFVLPVRDGETPEQAAQRYLYNLERNADMMELFEGRVPDLSAGEFRPLEAKDPSERALMIANLPKDYTQNSKRVENFAYELKESGDKSYLLPISADLGLTTGERRALLDTIAKEFGLLIPLGGDDVDPSLYKKENFHARNTNITRDTFEIALIRNYVAKSTGFLFAVCRGAQLSAVSLGYKLIQDIPFHIGKNVPHANNSHPIKLFATKYGLLNSVMNLPLFKGLAVNSLHHQSIIYREGGPLELAAVADDGITEALEGKNGRILLLQFHPELMENALGRAIIQAVIKTKRALSPRSCSGLF